jgi:hypothetical protein
MKRIIILTITLTIFVISCNPQVQDDDIYIGFNEDPVTTKYIDNKNIETKNDFEVIETDPIITNPNVQEKPKTTIEPDTASNICGNNNCENNEVFETCPQDCKAGSFNCGNNVCEGGESYESCSNDCTLQDILGTNANDGACQPGEDINNAPNDCTIINPNCGNGVCDSWETKKTCYEDCPVDPGEDDGNSCLTDSGCGYHQACKSGKCVTVDCTNDAQCSGCKKCSSNSCVSCGYGAYGICSC